MYMYCTHYKCTSKPEAEAAGSLRLDLSFFLSFFVCCVFETFLWQNYLDNIFSQDCSFWNAFEECWTKSEQSLEKMLMKVKTIIVWWCSMLMFSFDQPKGIKGKHDLLWFHIRQVLWPGWSNGIWRYYCIIFSCASLIFEVATFLRNVYVYLRQKGYSCLCHHKCTSCLWPCMAADCSSLADTDDYINKSWLSSHLHVKEMWVWLLKLFLNTCKSKCYLSCCNF